MKKVTLLSICLVTLLIGFANVYSPPAAEAQPVVDIIQLEYYFPRGSLTPVLNLVWYYGSSVTILGSWNSISGNNIPDDQGRSKAPGPIPEGYWTVNKAAPPPGKPRKMWYFLRPNFKLPGDRTGGFYIHGSGGSTGCITIEQENKQEKYSDFRAKIDPILAARGTIRLVVDYSGYPKPKAGNADLPEPSDITQQSDYDYCDPFMCCPGIAIRDGGIFIPIDKFGLLAPYIGLSSMVIVATIAISVSVKRINRSKKKP